MEPADHFRDIAAQLIGRRVTSVWMVLYTLKIEVAPTDTDPRCLQIWLEPSWHVRSPERLLTGSGAIESPDDFGDDAEVARASATIERVSDDAQPLVGCTIERLQLDPVTFELCVAFSDGFVGRTFASDPASTLIWVLSDCPRSFALRGTAEGIVTGIRAGVV